MVRYLFYTIGDLTYQSTLVICRYTGGREYLLYGANGSVIRIYYLQVR